MEDFLKQLCEDIQSIARQCGKNMTDHYGHVRVEKTKVNFQDLVTKVDTTNQNMILEYMKEKYPEHVLLGEEDVEWGKDREAVANVIDKEWVWIVDPLDGTTNYVYALPLSVVSICVAHKGIPTVGVIFDPYRNEMFTTIKGHGAFMNNEPIHVRSDPTLHESLLGYATNYVEPVRKAMMRGVGAVGEYALNIRNIGAAALNLAWVAAGRLTGYWELGLHPWDVSAGCLLVQEAGGRAGSTRGEEYDLYVLDTLATNGHIHDEMLRILKSVNADRIEGQ
ncbi:inositol monophosphatase [Blastocystis sp. ATCC 50177/Nand II]|uniref:Inositol-1-monophosphatase n=1 Tax=Blastocystis sp. subtype 1 (strain ATCC 50177 / NandII) TaxID=478820 RepID=A0A196SIF0_BLAHN|nr:inositol monophosphatase [Blastocystis sp. ATCC 50177/Nand II]